MAYIEGLESLATESEREQGALQNVIKGVEQIIHGLAADLGNINAPAVSRTKRLIISETVGELNVLLLNLKALRPKAGGTGKEGE